MFTIKRLLGSVAAIAMAVALGGPASAQTQGVTKDEIVIGSLQDLSGPIALFGKQARNGMQMSTDDQNAKGTIHGRKLKLIVEDHGYDPRKAQLAGQKLLQQDKVFAIIGHIGTATNMAILPAMKEKNVLNLFPLTGARQMFEPVDKLKFAVAMPYYDQLVVALPKLIKEKGYKNVGILYQDDDFGQEVLQGAEDALKKVNMKLVEKTSFKRGATDFSTQVAKLKAANVDLIVLGTIIRETVGTIAETKKLGWKVDYLGVSALYTQMIPRLGRQAMDGLMGTNQVDVPYVDSASKEVAAWVAAYKAKFNEDPDVFAVYGYSFVNLFIAAAQKAGPNLTVDTMVAALESSEFPSDMFGSPVYKFSKTNHLGNDKTKIAVIKNGKWVNMTDYIGH